ncbi:MAG: hypothetical protein WC362_04605 [Methanoregula sp.]
MDCPVCGGDCVRPAHEVLAVIPTRFLPCPSCRMQVLDKRAPLPRLDYPEACSCKKRFIDGVFAHMYVIMREEGDLGPTDPLIAVGSPLVHPGLALDRPPFLPEKSLLLLSGKVTPKTARRIVAEVPEVKGVVRTAPGIPGLASHEPDAVPLVHTLLAGCDVRADIYPLSTGPLVVYKQQSVIHVEFPRAGYPKLRAVAARVGKPPVPLFVDACSGPGTLGLAAACLGVPHVIMNDAWYAAAFWSAVNIGVNRDFLDIDEVKICTQYGEMRSHPVVREPKKIAVARGRQTLEVYQGDFQNLGAVIPRDAHPVTALDVFDKQDRDAVSALLRVWRNRVGGDVFVP